jgi:hypothetical protein
MIWNAYFVVYQQDFSKKFMKFSNSLKRKIKILKKRTNFEKKDKN